MEGKHVERLERALEFLMERLSVNVDKVKSNSAMAKELINKDPFAIKLEVIRSENKLILDENKELLNLQISIRRFIALYGKKEELTNVNESRDELTREEWLDLTVKGGIKIDDKHPMAGDVSFLEDVLNHFTNMEEYEKCDQVLKLIQQLQHI